MGFSVASCQDERGLVRSFVSFRSFRLLLPSRWYLLERLLIRNVVHRVVVHEQCMGDRPAKSFFLLQRPLVFLDDP